MAGSQKGLGELIELATAAGSEQRGYFVEQRAQYRSGSEEGAGLAATQTKPCRC
jgi:hypothetical protein